MQKLNEALLRVLTSYHGLQTRFSEEYAQTLAEYSLLTAVIAVAVVVLALTAFRDTIAGVFNPVAQCLHGDGNCSGQFP